MKRKIDYSKERAAKRHSVRSLLEAGADVSAKNEGFGMTALHEACSRHRWHLCFDENHAPINHLLTPKFLIENGADVHAKDNLGLTPLLRACMYGHSAIIKLLIDSGADVRAKSKSGLTPLHWACCTYCAVEDCELMLDNGADISAKDDGGMTPLHYACLYAHLELVQLLLSRGANVDVEAKEGKTPLHLASETSRLDIVWLLERQYPCRGW